MRVRAIVAASLVGATALVAAGGSVPILAAGNAGIHFHKTVASAVAVPVLTLNLAVDHPSAIPGDNLTYSGTVANTATSWSLTGAFTAESHADASVTVAYYWDELQYCFQGCGSGENKYWTSIAAFVAGQPGYTPVVAPDLVGGMVLTAVGTPATGVTYPPAGDGILGSTVAPGATATWRYQATVTLTPAQVALLSDPTKVQATRNLAHFEVTSTNPLAAVPWSDSATFTNSFSATANAGDATNLVVKVTEPNGSTVNVNIGTLAPGASAPYSTTFTVPVPAPKAAGETDAAYLSRLTALEGSLLTATATLSGTGSSGPVSAPAPAPVFTVEHLPMVTIAKTGPPSVDAGTDGVYTLALANIGGATAGPLLVTDSVPGGATGTVTGVPTTLSASGTTGDTATATATFAVPANQPAGSLTDTATVAWQDANHNPYGPVSSQFTTDVRNKLLGARLTLAPESAGPNDPGTTQTLTATLLDGNGHPIAGQLVTFNVTGANPGSGTATTDATGQADFTYTGANVGNDVVQATVTAGGVTVNSNTSTVSWSRQLQRATITPVQGNFFPNSADSCTFDVGPGSTPVFGQTFPDILFNPAATVVPHDISTVNNFTRPFTDLTVDVNGNYNGQIVAQGNGQQAGSGGLINFYGVFTGNLLINEPGDLTFRILHDDGYIFGVGNGATRVNGDLEGNPPATTPFNGYGVVAAWNTGSTGSSSSGPATVHFPVAGSYPFELDYTECNSGPLFLDLVTEQFVAQTDPLSIYVGYADGLRAGGSAFPFPWQGSPGVTFIGGCTFDAGALRFDNSGDTDIKLDKVTVDLGNFAGAPHFDLWPAGLIVPAHKILILTQTDCFNFDTSDFSNAGCGGNNGVLPLVNVTRDGVKTTFTDTHQILNTRGFDLACQSNESTPWQRIAGTADTINVPLPPAASLDISPFNVPSALLGQNQALTVAAMDGGGNPVANLPVTMQVFGPNARTLSATTSLNGLAVFGYVGTHAGTDSIQASAFISGLRAISNLGSVTWTAPLGGGPDPGPNPDPNAPPPPSITSPTPPDGTIVTKPVSITATVAPPAGQTIASWRVFYQALDPGPQVVIASGSGSPPATLATFDPTQLPNDTYGVTVEATASGGGIQDLTTTVVVFGDLKLGRYTTAYQDLSVPVNGFQMEVRRTYDSIDKSSGDFGVGWRVSLSNFRLAPNRVLGAGGWTMYNKQCFLGLCFTGYKNSAPRFVTVTFPDQHTEVFDFTPQGGSNLFWDCTPAFTARTSTGTTSTLEAVDDTSCSYNGDGNIYGSNGPYSPNRLRLTTLDGTVLVLDRTLGLISERDRNGNTLSVDSAGVHSSSGGSISFTRDGAGRITRVTGPSGQSLGYTYSSAGDLAISTDPDGNQTSYTYDAAHDLLSASGGAQPLQSFQYDSSGRLVAITDAQGNTTTVANDVAGRQETVTDPLGRLITVYTMDDLGDVIRIDRISGGTTLTTSATYDSVGRPLSRTDPLGHVWTGSYDSNGDLLSLSPPSGGEMSITYNTLGAPLALRDAAGNQTLLAYDSAGNLLTFTDPLGNEQSLGYDASGNRTSLTDPLGNQTTFTFDAGGHNTSVTDAGGHVTHFAYDASGRLVSTSDALGRSTAYSYDGTGHVTSITDAAGGRTAFTYGTLGVVVSVADAAGQVTTYGYDASHRLTSTTDPLGHSTSYQYDANGNLTRRTDPTGGVTTYAYDGFGRLVSETDQLGRTTSYAYDLAGRLTAKTLANGGRFVYAYDADGRQTSSTDPLGRISRLSYDAVGNAVKTTDPLGAVTSYTVDALGRRIATTDALGHTTATQYDGAGRVVSTTDQLGKTTAYAYDGVGNRISMTNPLGAVTRYGYDAGNQLVTIADPLGRTTTSTFDAVGRLASVRLPSGSTTAYSYDPVGRLVSVVDGLGHTTALTYDAAGRRSSSTDPKGNSTTFTYDATGRQTSMTDALGGVVASAYDAAGQLTSVTNPRGDRTTFTYDALGDVASQTGPSGKAATHTYDAAGEMISQTDPRGQILTFAYDAAGRLTKTTFPTGTVSFSYDAVGQRASMVDSTGTTRFSYDAGGNLISVAASQGTVGYTYDAAGRRTSMSMPVRGSIGYAYDAAGQLSAMTDWTGGVFHFTYTPDGQTGSIAGPAGITSAYSYDAADRLTAIDHSRTSGTIAHFGYTLDANGNPTSATSAAGTDSYSVDALNRLVGVNYANGDRSTYTYDAAGNRLSRTVNGSTTTTYVYDSAGRLTSAGGTTFTYDAAGNLTSAGSSTFSWDWANRLSSATAGGSTSSYTYDGDGVRVAAQTGTAATTYLWDRAAPLPTLIDDGSQAYAQTDQGLLEQSGTATGQAFPLADALGSIRDLADATGSVVGTANYDAFGSIRSRSGSSSAFGFTGQQADPTGLVFLRARYYDPSVGRFLSADSVQPNALGTQGYNLYSYVANNPAADTDPSGHDVGYVILTRTWQSVVVAALVFAFRVALVGLLAVLLAAILAPEAERVARDINQEARDIFNRIMGEEEPKPQPKPKPCIDTECFPVPPVAPTPTPGKCTAGVDAVPDLLSRAESIRAVEQGTPAYYSRAVADLRVRTFADQTCLDVIGAGAEDLTRSQQTAVGALTGPPAVVARLSDRHAEVTVLNAASQYGLPLALGVTFAVCTPESRRPDTCRLEIASSGGIITPDQHGAYWPANQL